MAIYKASIISISIDTEELPAAESPEREGGDLERIASELEPGDPYWSSIGAIASLVGQVAGVMSKRDSVVAEPPRTANAAAASDDSAEPATAEVASNP